MENTSLIYQKKLGILWYIRTQLGVVSSLKQLFSPIFTHLCKINHNYLVLVLPKGSYFCSIPS
jgi:hypothetical protein